MQSLLEDWPGLDLKLPDEPPVTPEIQALRHAPLDERKAEYLKDRIEDQRSWYASKARHNAKRSDMWKAGLILAELLGAVGAVLKAVRVIDLDTTSVISTGIGCGVAWPRYSGAPGPGTGSPR